MPPAVTRYTVVVDSREQRGFPFAGAVVAKLDAGDYSILGLEKIVSIERKSLSDLFGTAGQGRRRFERELQKLAAYRYAAIVIEGNLDAMIRRPPPRSKMNPKSVATSLVAWSLDYHVHVWFASDRDNAWAITAHILEKFWARHQAAQLRAAAAPNVSSAG